MNTTSWRAWSCTIELTAAHKCDLEPARRVVEQVMGEVNASANRFEHSSDLSRLNANSGRYVIVRPLTIQLLELAIEVADQTHGNVTPTIGAALLAQGYDDEIDVVRSRQRPNSVTPSSTTTAPAPVARSAIRIDYELCRAGVTAGTVLDLGALAKAYAVDEAIVRIADRGLGGVLVSIGGDLAVHGGPDQEWPILASETADGPAQAITITEGAVATSSTVTRRWADGRHHIIDPHTGSCAADHWRTATVWAPTAVEANTMSTWALVAADEAERALAVRQLPARLVSVDGRNETRHGWPSLTRVVGSVS